MPVRSIKVKLIVPRGHDAESTKKRRALWDTHAFVNEAVAHYEQLLLEMRQGDVYVGEDVEGKPVIRQASEWKGSLIQRMCRNGMRMETALGALPHLRALYEAIVPSVIKGQEGTAQAARAYHSPLVDATSTGGEASARKRKDFAECIASLESPDFAEVARKHLEQRPELTRAVGAPPKWLRLFRTAGGDPAWVDALRVDLEKLVSEKKPDELAVVALRQVGALPLSKPWSESRIVGLTSALHPLERMSFSLAVDHLLSWESWTHRAQDQYLQRQRKLEAWDAEHASTHRDALHEVRTFEANRSRELAEVAFWSTGSTYRLRPRELGKGWTKLRDWLRSTEGRRATESERIDRVHALQTELGREFGSEVVLKWLSHPAQQWLVDHAAGDVITRIAVRNVFQGVCERTRQFPTFTHADALRHPRFAGFSPPSDANQPPFKLEAGENGRLVATIELLIWSEEGFRREKVAFAVAPTGQLPNPHVPNRLDDAAQGSDSKRLVVRCMAQDRLDPIDRVIGGSNLLFDRAHLEQAGLVKLRAGGIGSVWLKLSVDADQAEDGLRVANGKVAGFLSAAAGNRTGKSAKNRPTAPVRILSVDLGLRTAACGAVFDVSPDTEAASVPTAWPVDLRGSLAAQHERSFRLELPGERAEDRVAARREAAWRAVRSVLASIARLQALARLARARPVDRAELLAKATAAMMRTDDDFNAVPLDLSDLTAKIGDVDFLEAVQVAWKRYEAQVAEQLSAWRKSDGAEGRELFGKSAEGIEYKEAVLKALRRWNRHQAPWKPEVQRYNRASQGSVARRLVDHLTALKEDRVKSTADLIVQAARGIVHIEGKGWSRRHLPVHVIVLEDLSRYRFRSDRPRAENRQLMRWSHREITNAVKLQADAYGISVIDSAEAAFSSRFDAWTRAPGVRARCVTRGDHARLAAWQALLLDGRWPDRGDGFLCRSFARALCGPQVEPVAAAAALARLQVGDLVPMPGGELFVGPHASRDNGVRVRHADINAAQNIGARLIEAYSNPFRLSARMTPDGARGVTRQFGERGRGAWGQPMVVLQRQAGAAVLYKAHPCTAREAEKQFSLHVPRGGDEADGSPAMDEDALALQEGERALSELEGEWTTFFRDPSGRIWPEHSWVQAKVFWQRVHLQLIKSLRSADKLHG